MDVKTSFLNGFIKEEVYIEQPKGFETFHRESHVARIFVKGYSQVEGSDYEETFELVASYSPNRSLVWLHRWCGRSTRWM